MDYVAWHKKNLPTWCYCVDIDSVEVRKCKDGKLRIACIIDRSEVRNGCPLDKISLVYKTSKFANTVYHLIAFLLGVPYCIVYHTPDGSQYRVVGMNRDYDKVMTEAEFIHFQLDLGTEKSWIK